MITILATLQAKPDMGEQLEHHLKKVLAPSRSEAGCISYTLHRVNEHPDTFVFYEVWESQQALEAHVASPHYEEYRNNTASLVADRDVKFLTVIED